MSHLHVPAAALFVVVLGSLPIGIALAMSAVVRFVERGER